MDIDMLKRKLRELKKEEKKIRFGGSDSKAGNKYIWDEFFSTRTETCSRVKYPLWMMAGMDKQHIKEIIEEYFYAVYFQMYRESGLSFGGFYDPELLSFFGLGPGADEQDIKRKFRELAKKYHPDCGGDGEKMIELLDAYHKLGGGR